MEVRVGKAGFSGRLLSCHLFRLWRFIWDSGSLNKKQRAVKWIGHLCCQVSLSCMQAHGCPQAPSPPALMAVQPYAGSNSGFLPGVTLVNQLYTWRPRRCACAGTLLPHCLPYTTFTAWAIILAILGFHVLYISPSQFQPMTPCQCINKILAQVWHMNKLKLIQGSRLPTSPLLPTPSSLNVMQ